MPGNSNWRERLSSIDLLVQKDSLLKLSQVLFWSAFTNLQNTRTIQELIYEQSIMPRTSNWWKRLSAIDLLVQKDSLLQLSQVLFWSAFTNLQNTTTVQELIYEQKIMPGTSNWKERLSTIALLVQKDSWLQLSQV